VKFERVELPPIEEERDESRERQLGLIEPERRQERVSEAPMSADLDELEGEGDIAGDEEEGS
jgi:small subunit ribosomal protein S6